MTTEKTSLIVSAIVNAPVEKAWNAWTAPEHIVNWNFASDDWHCPSAENDIRVGGKLKATMAAKDGSFAFDFEGIYTVVDLHKAISFVLPDGRQVDVTFAPEGNTTHVTEVFDAETENSLEMQQQGWQMILNNFKKYTESI
ncbi:MAG: SRPBCC family protein [Bacteroidia bacterium]